jgi:large subunit ribosomal protein L12
MEEVYCAMLLHKAGKEINEESVKKVLDAAGVKVEEAKIKALVASLDGVDIEAAIKEAAVAPVAAAESGSEAGEEKKEAKEEKKKEDEGKSQEEAAAGLGALFG